MQSTSKKITQSEALTRARTLCARKEQSVSEILLLLQEWGLKPESAEEVIGKLKSEKFIDEGRYASAYIKDKTSLQKWGLVKIKFALKSKGIPSSLAEEAINEFDMTEYRSMIKNELIKKKKSIKGSSFEGRQKLVRFGISRGYETDIVYSILDEIFKA